VTAEDRALQRAYDLIQVSRDERTEEAASVVRKTGAYRSALLHENIVDLGHLLDERCVKPFQHFVEATVEAFRHRS